MIGRQGGKPSKGAPIVRHVRETHLHLDGVLGCASSALTLMQKGKIEDAAAAIDRLVEHIVDARGELNVIDETARGMK